MRTILNIVFLTSFWFAFSQSNWKLEKNEEGIQVFTRKKEGYAVKEYKATMVVKSSKTKLLKTIVNGDSLQYWTYKTNTSELLNRESDSVYYVYMYNDFPWPVKNRDHVSKLTVSYPDKTSVKVKIESAPEYIKEKENTLRVTNFSGYWLFEEKENDVQVTQLLAGDPGGYLPNFIVNSMLVKAPFTTFLHLKKRVEQ